jgi:hypothetical protein
LSHIAIVKGSALINELVNWNKYDFCTLASKVPLPQSANLIALEAGLCLGSAALGFRPHCQLRNNLAALSLCASPQVVDPARVEAVQGRADLEAGVAAVTR